MVKKFTLLELHLDDARFSNAVGGTPEAAEELLEGIDTDIHDERDAEAATDELEASGRSVGRTLRRAAVLAVVAVGIRTIARRVLSEDLEELEDVVDEDSIPVDLDERVEA
jgi:HAMP domain-containing protein